MPFCVCVGGRGVRWNRGVRMEEGGGVGGVCVKRQEGVGGGI